MGASTGGPSALQKMLGDLPSEYPLPIMVVQHMPPVFTRQFATRLDRNTQLSAREAEEGDRLEPGRILVAPGGTHLALADEGGVRVRIRARSDGDRYVPSVDVTMSCAADFFGARAVGVLLTGMGNDGAQGMLRIAKAGGKTIAESEESAVVYGMPRAAVQAGAAQSVLHLDLIPHKVLDVTSQITRLKKEKGGVSN